MTFKDHIHLGLARQEPEHLVSHICRTFLARTETFIYTQLRHLRYHRAVVVARDLQNLDRYHGVNYLAFSEKSEGVPRWISNLLYNSLRIPTGYERRFFLQAIGSLRPSLIHVHYAVEAAYFAPVTSRVAQPVIVSCYGYDVSSFPNRHLGYGRRYLQRAWTAGHCFLAMSSDMRNDLVRQGCPPDKIRVHYHGIDLRRFPYLKRVDMDAPVRILYVGSLGDERKGVNDLLRAFDGLVRQRPTVELRLVGDGRFHSEFKRQAQSLGISERVSFAGFVPHHELWKEYHAAHVFCHPSVTPSNGDKEGIPGTIVEAMATGLPVVTTRHAGIPEMVIAGVHGFVVGERDRPAIVAGLRRLVDDPALRARLGGAAAERARSQGDAVRQTAALESIYDEVLATVRRGESGT